MPMGYGNYLNDGGQFAIDDSKRKMSEVIPAGAVQVASPTSRAFCNVLNSPAYFVANC
jgi:hypothetical protein